jgi:ADP-ribosylglycohydrolase
MRAAPVGIFFRNDFDEMKLAAGLQAMVTHNDRMAIASSIVMAHATAKLLRMNVNEIDDLGTLTLFCRDLAETIGGIEDGDEYLTRSGGNQSTLAKRIGEDIPKFLEAKTPPVEVQKLFWSGAYVLESLPFALYGFLYSPGHFDRVLFNSVNESKDSDTVAAMACTLCGALNGLNRNMDRKYWTKTKGFCDRDLLPATPIDAEKDYMEELEFKDELIVLADRLTAQAWV